MSTLIIGYGNMDRGDDGVAFAVINELRRQTGTKILEEGDTGLDDLGHTSDSVFIPQLVPEMIEIVAGYDAVVFVDAHVGDDLEDLNFCAVVPEYVSSPFTHHMTPPAFMAFLKTLYQCEPRAHLVSIRGHEFDFTRTLSPGTRVLVEPAVRIIRGLIQA